MSDSQTALGSAKDLLSNMSTTGKPTELYKTSFAFPLVQVSITRSCSCWWPSFLTKIAVDFDPNRSFLSKDVVQNWWIQGVMQLILQPRLCSIKWEGLFPYQHIKGFLWQKIFNICPEPCDFLGHFYKAKQREPLERAIGECPHRLFLRVRKLSNNGLNPRLMAEQV